MNKIIDSTYLPFTPQELEPHFVSKAEEHIAYYHKSAKRYHSFLNNHRDLSGLPITVSRFQRQIEKDERFWIVTALKSIFDNPKRNQHLIQMLSSAFGKRPPINNLGTWEQCLDGNLYLFFEANLPSPESYKEWLRQNIKNQHFIPYVLDAAKRDNARAFEGATHTDGLLINSSNGFSIIFEAKVLSDISYMVSFDIQRNQFARNIDVMLENNPRLAPPLKFRNPDYSLFILLTPEVFRKQPNTRLYGWLFNEYRNDPKALSRDLPHRDGADWDSVAKRIGWVTFEDIEKVLPKACPWLSNSIN
jgi:hypothetical protein